LLDVIACGEQAQKKKNSDIKRLNLKKLNTVNGKQEATKNSNLRGQISSIANQIWFFIRSSPHPSSTQLN
jgi:hypothetical protein